MRRAAWNFLASPITTSIAEWPKLCVVVGVGEVDVERVRNWQAYEFGLLVFRSELLIRSEASIGKDQVLGGVYFLAVDVVVSLIDICIDTLIVSRAMWESAEDWVPKISCHSTSSFAMGMNNELPQTSFILTVSDLLGLARIWGNYRRRQYWEIWSIPSEYYVWFINAWEVWKRSKMLSRRCSRKSELPDLQKMSTCQPHHPRSQDHLSIFTNNCIIWAWHIVLPPHAEAIRQRVKWDGV